MSSLPVNDIPAFNPNSSSSEGDNDNLDAYERSDRERTIFNKGAKRSSI